MKITAEPRSDQFNADDLVSGPRTFTIAGVKPGKAEQKYDIELEGEERVWRPPLTVLRLMLAGWKTDDADKWVGQRVTLFRDPDVDFGGSKVGGIRISHMTGIDKPLVEALTVKRGKRGRFTVQPLKDEAPQQIPQHPTPEEVAACTDRDRLLAWYHAATGDLKALIKARGEELKAAAESEPSLMEADQ